MDAYNILRQSGPDSAHGRCDKQESAPFPSQEEWTTDLHCTKLSLQLGWR
jgi:hypothetical protein